MTKAEWITALRCCPVGLVVMPAAVVLMDLLGEQDQAWKWVQALAVYWAIMAPLLLLHLHLDRKEKRP